MLIFHFQGEHFGINLSCTTYSVNVELEKQVVRFLDTYNSMVRQVTFKIYNKSPNILSYFCMKNESIKRGNDILCLIKIFLLFSK